MEYHHSEEVDQSLYETHGLMNGIPLRIHKDLVKEIQGALRAQRDWNEHVQPIKSYHGSLGDPYSFIRVTVPECLPERLEIISYADEFAFLYDGNTLSNFLSNVRISNLNADGMENLDLKSYPDETARFLEPFVKGVLDKQTGVDSRPEKRLQAQILSEMMAIDSARAITSMTAWATFVRSAAQSRVPLKSMEEYVPARIIDAGELYVKSFSASSVTLLM